LNLYDQKKLMTILVAPDKFKGSLTAEEVVEAVSEGIMSFDPSTGVICFPLADGGDGTARILTLHNHGRMVKIRVNNPVFEPVEAQYGLSGDGLTAFVEMSAASGLRVLAPEKQNCFHTSTYGTGELILDALRRGACRIIMGIGGSATNDAGIGMAAALGYRFLDEQGRTLDPVGRNLAVISRIDASQVPETNHPSEVQVACDVDNPLYGKRGAAYVYGPQKGASPEELDLLDEGLMNFARVVREQMGLDVAEIPGAGAAGGLGAGCMVFLNARLVPGIRLVMEQSGFEEAARQCDLIITGEGRVDEQTFRGKVIDGVCRVAAKYHKPVLVICGQNTLDEIPPGRGILAIKSLSDHYGSSIKAMTHAYEGLIRLANDMMCGLQEPC
jgi:glycerate kinase